jgi:hypothetical protein
MKFKQIFVILTCMNNILKGYDIGIVALFIFSCNQPNSEIQSATKMIDRAEQTNEALTESDLEQLEKKMDQLQKNLDQNRDKYPDEQVKEIGKLQGRYTSVIVKKGISDFKKSVKDIGNQMEGFIEGMSDTNNKNNQ